jgi:hypothetical protein
MTRVSHLFVSGLLPLFGLTALFAASNACAALNSWTLDSPSSRLQVKRELTVPLNFLPDGNYYQLDSWADGVNADCDGTDFRYSTLRVSSAVTLTLNLAPGGGWAGRLTPAMGIAP